MLATGSSPEFWRYIVLLKGRNGVDYATYCSVCGKEIPIFFMDRKAYVYKFIGNSGAIKYQCSYTCNSVAIAQRELQRKVNSENRKNKARRKKGYTR